MGDFGQRVPSSQDLGTKLAVKSRQCPSTSAGRDCWARGEALWEARCTGFVKWEVSGKQRDVRLELGDNSPLLRGVAKQIQREPMQT